jgi:hypothetical protein
MPQLPQTRSSERALPLFYQGPTSSTSTPAARPMPPPPERALTPTRRRFRRSTRIWKALRRPSDRQRSFRRAGPAQPRATTASIPIFVQCGDRRSVSGTDPGRVSSAKGGRFGLMPRWYAGDRRAQYGSERATRKPLGPPTSSRSPLRVQRRHRSSTTVPSRNLMEGGGRFDERSQAVSCSSLPYTTGVRGRASNRYKRHPALTPSTAADLP